MDRIYNKRVQPVIDKLGMDEVRARLYSYLKPFGYHNVEERLTEAMKNPSKDESRVRITNVRDNIFAEYLQIPKEKRRIYDSPGGKVVDSKYSPTVGGSNTPYKAITLDETDKENLVEWAEAFPQPIGENALSTALGIYFGTHTIGRGLDPQKGEYISYYDKWDLAPYHEYGEDESKGIGKPINFYDRLYLNDYFKITPEIEGYYGGYIAPAIVDAEKLLNGGLLTHISRGTIQKYDGGGPTKKKLGARTTVISKRAENIREKLRGSVDSTKGSNARTHRLGSKFFTASYSDLPVEGKRIINELCKELNIPTDRVEESYNSGRLDKVIAARYKVENPEEARVRENDSPTKKTSEEYEARMNKSVYHSANYVAPNMPYAIPYLTEKEIKVPGVGRVSTNALDSLAKYAAITDTPLSDALGLAAQETAFGALPLMNYTDDDSVDNRALGNSSYFRNYGEIPAENFVRDFRYNSNKPGDKPIDRSVPPLQHAFEYFKKGNYNRGDKNHTSDVRAKGREVMKTKAIQDWIANSEFAQRALRKTSKHSQGGLLRHVTNNRRPKFDGGGDIPLLFDRPLKFNELPTNNKIHIIDNYSPTFNYIVEGRKIYMARKGTDEWRDISDNEKARNNLFNFLNDKYDFRGYEDDEREIFQQLKSGAWNYQKYHESVTKPTSQEDTKPSPKDETLEVIYNGHPVSMIVPEHSMLRYIAAQGVTPRVGKVPKAESAKVEGPLKEEEKPQASEKTSVKDQAAEDGYKNNIWTKLSLAPNWLKRQKQKLFNNDEESALAALTIDPSSPSEYGIVPGSFTGDTVRVSKRQYILPESLDVTTLQFAARNRGDNRPLETEAAVITTFRPFKPLGSYGSKTYIGIDKNGKLKVGSAADFEEGDMVSPSYSNVIYDFVHDSKGGYVWQRDGKHGNPGYNVPQARVLNEETGQIDLNFPLNVLSRPSDTEGKTYGNVTGGRVLVQVGEELRLLSGSIRDIEQEFEAMKKRQGTDHGTFYTMDNGSYNRGFRTYDGKFTTNDLVEYDKQNEAPSGNFLYLIGAHSYFPSDTVKTEAYRKPTDESAKKGHPLTNEQKGVVLHHTGFFEEDLGAVTKYFQDLNNEASAHVIIGQDGRRRVFGTPDQVMWHAGKSYWNGRDEVNDFMIGIEFQGDTQKGPLTEEQIQSAVEYLIPIIRKAGIALEDITTHQQVRELYNQYRKKLPSGSKKAPDKNDLTFTEYQRIITELKKRVYYKK